MNIRNKKKQRKVIKRNPFIGIEFVDPICDVGFKKIMSNEEILVDFLNTFLPRGTPKIVSATLLPEERLGKKLNSKRVFFDVRAKDNFGKSYIIEVQRKPQEFFVERSIYYNSREISSQGEIGKLKKYNFSPVYSISVLNFVPKAKWSKHYYNVFTYRRKGTNEELTDVTAQIIILLPLMKLSSEKLQDRRAKWCYLLKYAVKLNRRMLGQLKWTEDEIFEKIREVLHVSNLSDKELAMLDEAQKIKWDYEAMIDYNRELATEEKAKLIAKNMLADGLSIETIAKYVDLPESRVRALKASMSRKKR